VQPFISATLGAMLREGAASGRELPRFEFENRNRRPAARSRQCDAVVRLRNVGQGADGDTVGSRLRPLSRVYHQPRYGRPALALDIMEPFRPILADSR